MRGGGGDVSELDLSLSVFFYALKIRGKKAASHSNLYY